VFSSKKAREHAITPGRIGIMSDKHPIELLAEREMAARRGESDRTGALLDNVNSKVLFTVLDRHETCSMRAVGDLLRIVEKVAMCNGAPYVRSSFLSGL
jgi:hypothetical protein